MKGKPPVVLANLLYYQLLTDSREKLKELYISSNIENIPGLWSSRPRELPPPSGGLYLQARYRYIIRAMLL